MISKKKIFIAIDTNKVSKAKKIIMDSRTNKIKVGYIALQQFKFQWMHSTFNQPLISTEL